MIGLEFVKDQKTKEPYEASVKVRSLIMLNALEEGLVIYPGGGSVDGVRGDHILIAPPISITREEIDKLYEMLKAAILKTMKDLG